MNMNYIIISFSQYFVNCKIITQKVYMFGDLINCGAHFFELISVCWRIRYSEEIKLYLFLINKPVNII